MTEVVQLFGYESIPVEEARERLKPLVEKYGKETIADATAELVQIESCQTPVARLTDEVRLLARQMIGRPPPATSSSTEIPKSAGQLAHNATDQAKLPNNQDVPSTPEMPVTPAEDAAPAKRKRNPAAGPSSPKRSKRNA